MIAKRLVLVTLLAPFVHSAPAKTREVTNLRDLTTNDLISRLEAQPKLERLLFASKSKHHREAVLHELMRRGDDALQSLQEFRQRLVVNERTSGNQLPGSDDDLKQSLANDVALLTTLRHLQGKSPPLKINVQCASAPIPGKTRELPELQVEVVNVDPEKSSVWFTFGGDYRSGRLARWRIHVWDEQGNQLPVLPSNSVIGGGVCRKGNLGFGERDRRYLDIGDFVRIPKPGTYKAQAMYHNAMFDCRYRTI